MASSSIKDDSHFHRIEDCLRLVDPILQFLTRATNQDRVPLSLIRKAIPTNVGIEQDTLLLRDIQVICFHGILILNRSNDHSIHEDATASLDEGGATSEQILWDDASLSLGFPLPSPHHKLHGSSKAAAKRRLAALHQKLQQPAAALKDSEETISKPCFELCGSQNPTTQPAYAIIDSSHSDQISCGGDPEPEDDLPQVKEITSAASEALRNLLAFPKQIGVAPSHDDDILPRQASFAGSTPAQDSIYASWSGAAQFPPSLIRALGLENRPLYSHQVAAIEAAFEGTDCIVCTGTGSGKSLCYLIPALAAAYNFNQTSLLLFPTKALAQDQLTKLMSLVSSDVDLLRRIRPATLDGDTTFSSRSRIHECNILLANPDILHTTVLPAWKTKGYQSMLASIRYVALDEAHMYDGVFGAHVAMILRRLVRIAVVAAISNHPRGTSSSFHMPPTSPPTFIATSATLPWPAEHFRLLCPIGSDRPIQVISKDGSPRSAKHFFVWNPPVLHLDGSSTGKIFFPKATRNDIKSGLSRPETSSNVQSNNNRKRRHGKSSDNLAESFGCKDDRRPIPSVCDLESDDMSSWTVRPFKQLPQYRRRHAAEETARLLARAVVNGVRCIAFCKTRNLVEWIYTMALEALESHSDAAQLCPLIESYRGGYSITERRKIEDRLYRCQILAVVATNALELGVDIGGIDLTLHCGYPSSYASLLQQVRKAIITPFSSSEHTLMNS
jgi:DEAD/DEAH box helicase/Helicase conserved C-terminal domain